MNWYRVTREDGSYSWVQATSKSEASQKVRNAGELIKLVKEVNESAVPASAKGGMAEPTTPTPTTPTPTTPTPTTPTPTTPTPYTSQGSAMYQYIQNKIAQGLPLTNPEKAYLTSSLSISPPKTQLQTEYEDYLAYQKDNPFMPVPKDFNDYTMHYKEWINNTEFYQMGYTQEQIDNYDRFNAFASKYGDLNDYRPTDLADFLANYDKAQGQLDTWTQEAGPEATGFTDNQVREYYAFKDYASQYGKPGEWFPVDIGDFFANYDQAEQQLGVWQQQAEAVEQYELSPEEAARRREEAYGEGRYAAKERYGETPEYQPAFAQWMGGQEQFSGALQQYVEREYPSLKSEFQATQPTLTGYASREAARADKAKREQAFKAWLPEQVPGLEQEYWSQRPLERGERPYMYSPAMVEQNW